MSADEKLRSQLGKLRSAISADFRSLTADLAESHGTDLCMVGLQTASDLGYLAPVCAFRSKFEDAAKITNGVFFSRSIYDFFHQEEVELSAVNELLDEIRAWETEFVLALVYEAILAGLEDAKAHELVSQAGVQFAVLALPIGGTDWGQESVTRRLNPWLDIEEIFPPRDWLKHRTAAYRGPKSSWTNPWGTNHMMKFRQGVLFLSYNELWMFSLRSDELKKLHVTAGNGFTGLQLVPGRNHVVCISAYGAECIDLEVSALVWRINPRYRFNNISFSPSGNYFVAGSIDGPATVWKSADGRFVTELPHGEQDAWVMSAQWSPKDNRIATSGRNLGIRFWDSRSFLLLEEIPDGGDQLEFFPDGNQIAVASGYSRNSSDCVRTLNLEDGNWQRFEKTSEGSVNRLRISNDGNLVVAFTGMLSSRVEVYNREGYRISQIVVGLEVNDALLLDQTEMLLGGDWNEPTGPFIQWRFR